VATSALILAVALLAAPHGDAGTLNISASVKVEHTAVLLGDIVDVSPLPPALRMRAAALPVAVFKPGQQHMAFTSRQLFERARALMPALTPWLSEESATPVSVSLVPPSPPVATKPRPATRQCMRVERALNSGDTPVSSDLAPAPCGDAVTATAFRYDAVARIQKASRDLRSGEVIAAVPSFTLANVAPGQRVSLRSRIGPVLIEREVVALQSAGPGQSIFVQGPDGEVFSVLFADIAP